MTGNSDSKCGAEKESCPVERSNHIDIELARIERAFIEGLDAVRTLRLPASSCGGRRRRGLSRIELPSSTAPRSALRPRRQRLPHSRVGARPSPRQTPLSAPPHPSRRANDQTPALLLWGRNAGRPPDAARLGARGRPASTSREPPSRYFRRFSAWRGRAAPGFAARFRYSNFHFVWVWAYYTACDAWIEKVPSNAIR